MAVFAIYSRPSAHNASLAQQAEAVVVREGFSFWAMLMTPLWCLYHRAWRPLLGLILLGLVIEVLFGKTGLNNPALHSVMDGLIAVYIGFAAAELRGMALQRRGFDLVNVVVAEA